MEIVWRQSVAAFARNRRVPITRGHNRIKQRYLFFHPFKNVLKCKKANGRLREAGIVRRWSAAGRLETPESRRRKRRRRKRKRERGGPGGERSTSTRTSEAASEKGYQGVAGAHAGIPTGGWVATIRPGAAE